MKCESYPEVEAKPRDEPELSPAQKAVVRDDGGESNSHEAKHGRQGNLHAILLGGGELLEVEMPDQPVSTAK